MNRGRLYGEGLVRETRGVRCRDIRGSAARAWSTATNPQPPAPNAPTALRQVPPIGHEDHGLEGTEYVDSLKPLIAGLPPRDRQILSLPFMADMTQSEIGDEPGISQMHVSRLLSRTLVRPCKGLTLEE